MHSLPTTHWFVRKMKRSATFFLTKYHLTSNLCKIGNVRQQFLEKRQNNCFSDGNLMIPIGNGSNVSFLPLTARMNPSPSFYMKNPYCFSKSDWLKLKQRRLNICHFKMCNFYLCNNMKLSHLRRYSNKAELIQPGLNSLPN